MTDSLPNQMIRLMSDGQWHSADELIEKVSHRFSATKHVLEKRGYKFDRRRVKGQQFEYRLLLNVNQDT
ncbi:hypothetical protein [Baaleninema simplex]|uniref:hypothetical protein n=1 Tax=Baaleninema simplex TaxID=2862350 RepID=UPI0003622A5E|nr:hypothetical protein [Baaleninema simplex]